MFCELHNCVCHYFADVLFALTVYVLRSLNWLRCCQCFGTGLLQRCTYVEVFLSRFDRVGDSAVPDLVYYTNIRYYCCRSAWNHLFANSFITCYGRAVGLVPLKSEHFVSKLNNSGDIVQKTVLIKWRLIWRFLFELSKFQ